MKVMLLYLAVEDYQSTSKQLQHVVNEDNNQLDLVCSSSLQSKTTTGQVSNCEVWQMKTTINNEGYATLPFS
eukprot:5631644-Ditylum_brightwellii.AAC.1